MRRPTVVIADDHAIVVDGLRALLQEHATVVETFSDGATLLEGVRRLNPDVVVTDVSMPVLGGMDFLRALRRENGAVRVIMLSMYVSAALVQAAFASGANAYLPKHAAGEELLDALRAVQSGRAYISPLIDASVSRATPPAFPPPSQLTRRQREVVRHIAAGKRMKEIAVELRVSRRTVEMHKYEAMRQLGLRTTVDLIKYVLQNDAIV